MRKRSPFRYFNTCPQAIGVAVMMSIGFLLSLRNVEDPLYERGMEISDEGVRSWWNCFGSMLVEARMN
jgi:putative transposase